jgi:hypothetical protein
VCGCVQVANLVIGWNQIVDPREVQILMHQDALRAVNLVECKNLCVMISDDVFQGREVGVVEKCWAERYTGGLREAVFRLDVEAVRILRDV